MTRTFRSSHQWLAARLSFALDDSAGVLGSSEDEDNIEETEKSKALPEWLICLLPTLLPHVDTPEPTVISHDDLSFHNILVDDEGKITGIVAWLWVSVLPLWKACQVPGPRSSLTRIVWGVWTPRST
jgi:hypothetical protein